MAGVVVGFELANFLVVGFLFFFAKATEQERQLQMKRVIQMNVFECFITPPMAVLGNFVGKNHIEKSHFLVYLKATLAVQNRNL